MQEDFIKTELAKYNLPDAAIAKMKVEYMVLKVLDVDDVEGYMACKDAHQEVKKIRIAIENKRKELKSSSLDFGRAVDGEAKRLTVGVLEVEDHLITQRRVIEDEAKRKQEETERKEREEQEHLKRLEEERLEATRREQEETARKQQEAQEKIDEEKRANEAEKARLQEESERQEREKIKAREAELRAEQEKKDRIEREKRHAEEVEKAKKEAAERAVREEKERAEREAQETADAQAAEKEKAEHAKLIAPDKEKILHYGQSLEDTFIPEIGDEKAQVVLDGVTITLTKALERMRKEVETL